MTHPRMHRRRIVQLIAPLLDTAAVPLADLLDGPHRLMSDIVSPVDVPGFDNSSMDGYALAHATITSAGEGDTPSGPLRLGPLPVAGRVAAGATSAEVPAGSAVEIMTGAPLPPGVDTIVPIEDTASGSFGAETVTVVPRSGAIPADGAFVRCRGSDIAVGTTVLTAGTMLTPAHLGVAASCGIVELPVLVPPRILLVSTGDEVAHDSAAGIHDANGITLASTLRLIGCTVERLVVPDDPAGLLERVRASDADLVVSTGGVSKGAHEVVKLGAALDPDARMTFEAVAMQPGGPQGWGTMAGKAWVALPGNPVSALISTEMFLRPALLGLDVDADPRPVEFHALATDLDEAPPVGKLQIRRGRVASDGVHFVGGSRSHLLNSYARSTHLVFLGDEADAAFAAKGDKLRCWRIA